MTYISVGLRILISIAFVGAGGAKLAGMDMMVMTFDQIGWGQGFRYLTAAIEVIGGVLLWWPSLQVIGAAVLGGTMVGAVLVHQEFPQSYLVCDVLQFCIFTAPKSQKFMVGKILLRLNCNNGHLYENSSHRQQRTN